MIEGNDDARWARFGGKKKRPPGKRLDKPIKSGVAGFIGSLLLVLLVVAATLGGVLWARGHSPDPHFLVATEMIAAYEQGKGPDRRNYGHEVYQKALGELELVDTQSISADPALHLERHITRRIMEFRERIAAEELARQQAREAREKRMAVEYELRRMTRAHPRVSFPECETEAAGDGHDHTH